jgi:transposase
VTATDSTPERPEADEMVALRQALALAHLQIQDLKGQLRLALIKKYGPGSEKLSDAQLHLLGLEPGVSNVEVQAESVRESLPEPAESRKRRKHPGRQELPAELPRVERVIACAPEQCACSACGQPMAVIGYDVSEQLDVEPAKYFVVVTKREKRACKHCEESGVAAASAPARIVEKGLVSDRVVIDTVVAKYSDHLPLYRQSAILEREAGVEISRATMDGWVMRVGELLIPIAAVMGRELLGGSYIQADETTVDVQMHDGRGQNHQAYLWQYGRPGGGVVFDFRLGRGRDGPKKFLGQFEGILQTDGYGAYDHVGGLERSKPLLEVIRMEAEAARDASLPSSALGKAANYTLSLWRKLTRFLEHPELELSNNLAENSMRPVAQELDPRREPASRAESGSHSVHP